MATGGKIGLFKALLGYPKHFLHPLSLNLSGLQEATGFD